MKILCLNRDLMAELTPYALVKMGRKEGNLEELKKTILEPAIKKYLPLYVTILENSKSGQICFAQPFGSFAALIILVSFFLQVILSRLE